MQFGETVLPTFERATGEKPFDLTPFMRVPARAARHAAAVPEEPRRDDGGAAQASRHRRRDGSGRGAACARCRASRSSSSTCPAVGLQSVNLATLPKFKAELQLSELEAARAAGVDALVAVYHSDHRELCAHERDWPFRIMNILEIVGESMGLRQEDHYKNLKIKQDVDAIIADAADLMKRHERRSRHRAQGDRQRHARRSAVAAAGQAGGGVGATISVPGAVREARRSCAVPEIVTLHGESDRLVEHTSLAFRATACDRGRRVATPPRSLPAACRKSSGLQSWPWRAAPAAARRAIARPAGFRSPPRARRSARPRGRRTPPDRTR